MVTALPSSLLAETVTAATTLPAMIQRITESLHKALLQAPLEWCVALLVVGLVSIVWGWRIYRVLVLLAGAGAGWFFGLSLGETAVDMGVQVNRLPMILAGVGAVAFGLLGLPFLRFALFMLAGIAGGYVFYLAGLQLWPAHLPIIAAAGFVLCGLISMAFFQLVIVLGTSLLGAGMTMTGFLGIMRVTANDAIYLPLTQDYPLALAGGTILLALLGFAIQTRLIPEGGLVPPDKGSKGDASQHKGA